MIEILAKIVGVIFVLFCILLGILMFRAAWRASEKDENGKWKG